MTRRRPRDPNQLDLFAQNRRTRATAEPLRLAELADQAHAGTGRPRLHPVTQARGRLTVVALAFALAWAVVAGRLVQLAHTDPAEIARAGSTRAVAEQARADIVDRNGQLLATSLPALSATANPLRIADARGTAEAIATILPTVDVDRLARQLDRRSHFAWVARALTPDQADALNRLGLPGIEFRRELRRVYPAGATLAHSVGFTDVDGTGLSGIEQAMDERLRGDDGSLTLTIDLGVQHVVRQELDRAITDFDGIGGTAVVMDVTNGEIVALASLPDFDPHSPAEADVEARFNRASLGVYEMGSTFKVLNTALALETGTVGLTDLVDATRPIPIGRFRIRDFRPKNRWLSVPEVLIHSSNIGSARMAMEVGGDVQRAFLEKLGMGAPSPIELPERGQPLLPDPWRPANTMTVSYGHGIAVSPLNLVSAVAAVVNGGTLYPPRLVMAADGRAAEGRRVLSRETSDTMRKLMWLTVQTGTGGKSNVPGYVVGGKTGTADKSSNGRVYSDDARIASFIAAFPMTAPRYVVFVMVDEPKPNETSHGYATGGWVAAPAVGRIIARIGPMLGIEAIDESAPEIIEAMAIPPFRTDPDRATRGIAGRHQGGASLASFRPYPQR